MVYLWLGTWSNAVEEAFVPFVLQLMKRLSSLGAVNKCMEAVVHGDLVVTAASGASRADSLLPLYVPGERAQERRIWLADVLIALLQRAQVRGKCWSPTLRHVNGLPPIARNLVVADTAGGFQA